MFVVVQDETYWSEKNSIDLILIGFLSCFDSTCYRYIISVSFYTEHC